MAAGRVASVNVGRAAQLVTARRTVQSAIVKTPTTAAVVVETLGLARDEQADRRHHGGPYQAVYAYAGEDAAWWSEQLGRPLDPGAFGENLTLRGVDLSSARIGERWRIGTVELRVTAPRVPCFKLAARMGDRGFVARFGRAGRPGAYLAVERPGSLAAGDAVTLLARPDHAVTIGLAFAAGVTQRDRVDEVLAAGADLSDDLVAWLTRGR